MRRVPETEIGLIEMPESSRSWPPRARIHSDELLRIGRAHLVLDPRVEVLGRLAHDHDVHVLVARADARVALAGTHLAVEVETLAERDVDRAEASADRRRDRALERDAALADRVEDVVGKRVAAVLFHHVAAGQLDVPVELDSGRLEHAAGRLGQLGTGAVAGDEGDSVGHRRRLYRYISDPMNDFKPGLEGVVAVETEIAEPDREGGALRYRGYDIEELVGRYPYENIWGLLVDNDFDSRMPDPEPYDPAGADRATLPPTCSPRLRHLAGEWRLQKLVDIDDQQARDDLGRLSAQMMGIVARSAAVAEGREPASDDVVAQGKTAAEKFLLRWRGEANPDHVKAIDTYWICTAEHGLNASTFTARVVASTGADCGAAMSAAVGALSGPLHGGAPARVLPMLDEVAKTGDPEAYVKNILEQHGRIMGFGHRVYRAEDPRSRILKRTAQELGSPRIEVAEELEEAALAALHERKPDYVIATNVEFYSAVVLDVADVPPDLTPAMFACSRVAGWSAHILEQKQTGRLFRPADRYVGPGAAVVVALV